MILVLRRLSDAGPMGGESVPFGKFWWFWRVGGGFWQRVSRMGVAGCQLVVYCPNYLAPIFVFSSVLLFFIIFLGCSYNILGYIN